VISGIRRRVNESLALYVMLLSSPSLVLDFLTLEDGTDSLSRNAGNYQSTLRNILEERRYVFVHV
jgi:hypothetical protein